MVIFAKPNYLSFIIGISIAVLGEIMRFWGVAYIGGESRTTGNVGGSKLIISGPFAYTRNPLYIGNILIYLGIGIISNSLFPYLLIVAFCFFIFQYQMIIKDEEKYLLEKFKQSFIDYCSYVRRFIPRLTPYKSNQKELHVFNFKAGLKSETRTLQGFSLTIITLLFIWIYQNYGK
jgi:protein-S-isoprenylcysteine O-methyltransferase Ste14